MKRQIRLITLQNDAVALAAANFYFPIYKWKTKSERTKSLTNVVSRLAWIIQSKTLNQIKGLNPKKHNPHYLTLEERLQNLPKGYSPKIEEADCIFQYGEDIYYLRWKKETIHKSMIPEQDYQKWIIKAIRKVWGHLHTYYKKFGDNFQLDQFRPSILILESIRAVDNPSVELVDDEDLLIKLVSNLQTETNPISKSMYEIVYRMKIKRGVWEYRPKEENN